MKRLIGGMAALAALGTGAFAQNSWNGPTDGDIGMVPAGSKLAEEVHFFHDGVLLPIITIISVLVLALLLYVVFRYNVKSNPVPKKFSHNTAIEVVWTGVPILILLVIAFFSFDLLYKEDVIPDGKQIVARGDGATTAFTFANDFPPSRTAAAPKHVQVFKGTAAGAEGLVHGRDYTLVGLGTGTVAVNLKSAPATGETIVIRAGRSLVGGAEKEIALAPTMTLKATGYQWGWNYNYPDFGDFEFASNMLPKEKTTPELYRFEVDNRIIVPVGETIRVVTTARDVIHAFALPNFAIKIDAVPGRINETWFKADREGVYYGQCSEICGVRHSAMPIAVEVVSRPKFEAWVDSQRALAGLEPMFIDGAAKFADASAAAAQ
ncbi:MAG: cytochrome c oxidase subunit II transmembrane domain-containing protein [Parvularculaceae bacterium]|nr:cytochrome c oxidase subunit II transmembrane domain-containing protein [Parvularculaceae bacterium]